MDITATTYVCHKNEELSRRVRKERERERERERKKERKIKCHTSGESERTVMIRDRIAE